MSPDKKSDSTTDTEPAAVQLRVVSGNPTAEELAAVIAVVSAAAASSGDSEAPPAPAPWSAPSSMHRVSMPEPGPGVWAQMGRFR